MKQGGRSPPSTQNKGYWLRMLVVVETVHLANDPLLWYPIGACK